MLNQLYALDPTARRTLTQKIEETQSDRLTPEPTHGGCKYGLGFSDMPSPITPLPPADAPRR